MGCPCLTEQDDLQGLLIPNHSGILSLNSSKTVTDVRPFINKPPSEIYYYIICFNKYNGFPGSCRIFLSTAGNPKHPWAVQPAPGENIIWLWWVLIFRRRRRRSRVGMHLAWKWRNEWINEFLGWKGEGVRWDSGTCQHSLNWFAELTTASDESGCLKLRQIWTKYANKLQQLVGPLWGWFNDAQKFLHIWRRTCGRWCCSRLGNNFYLK